MPVCQDIYLNGAFTPSERARISPFDRGFLFAHAAYEVTSVYTGRFIDLDAHLARLARTLDGIEIPNPHSAAQWTELHEELIARNGMSEGLVYLQVTAGTYGERNFAGVEQFDPSVFMFANATPLIGEPARDGIRAILIDDTRWTRRDMKTTQLLSQALAYREATRGDAETAFMVEDGFITEAASANAWIVDQEGQLITRHLSPAILPGITRQSLLKLLDKLETEVVERAFTPDEAKSAREVFTTSSGALIAPVVELDGEQIGDGKPGPTTRQIQRVYYEAMGADVATVAPWVAV